MSGCKLFFLFFLGDKEVIGGINCTFLYDFTGFTDHFTGFADHVQQNI